MEIFRTPDERFDDLPGYPFAPRYLDLGSIAGFEGLRMHYLDEGPPDGPVMLMCHGMPTWSYLYRHMIPPLVEAGFRCVAPDLIGFGKSDKVLDDAWYDVARHQTSVRALVETLDLQCVTAMVQDWGGPIGLHQAAEMPERFERLCIMNTWLENPDFDFGLMARAWNAVWRPVDTTPGVRLADPSAWRAATTWVAARFARSFILKDAQPCGAMVSISCAGNDSELEAALFAAYEAPFPDDASKAGARRFPLSLPFWNPQSGAAESQREDFEKLLGFGGHVHFMWGTRDRVFPASWLDTWASKFPKATVDRFDADHFLQETHGAAIARTLLRRIRATAGNAPPLR